MKSFKMLLLLASGLLASGWLLAQTPQLVKDIGTAPGGAPVMAGMVQAFDTTVVFVKNNELWGIRGNGLAEQIATLGTPDFPDNVSEFIPGRTLTYFLTTNRKLWRTDGTSAGTFLVSDTLLGTAGLFLTDHLWATHGDTLAFAGFQDSSYNVWRTNGQPGNLQKLTDFPAGNPDSFIEGLAATSSLIFFQRYVPSGSYFKLWRTDGTSTGTSELMSVWSDGFSPRRWLTVWNDRVFISQRTLPNSPNRNLLVSDGTTAGTMIVDDLGLSNNWADMLTPTTDYLYYRTPIGMRRTNGVTWESVTAPTPEVTAENQLPKEEFIHSGNRFAFLYNGANNQKGIWMRKGATSSTWNLTGNTQLTTLIGFIDNTLYYKQNGRLWKLSDSGPQIVYDDQLLGLTPYFSSSPNVSVGSQRVFFVAEPLYPQSGGVFLMSISAATGATRIERYAPPSAEVSGYPYAYRAASDGSIYFFANDGSLHGHELWRTDGSTSGTYQVADVNPPNPDDYFIEDAGLPNLTTLGTNAYYLLRVPKTVSQPAKQILWRSNGTTAGTDSVRHFVDQIQNLTSDGASRLYLYGFYGRLWRSDGTPSGTQAVWTAADPANTEINRVVATPEKVLFSVTRNTPNGSVVDLYRYSPAQNNVQAILTGLEFNFNNIRLFKSGNALGYIYLDQQYVLHVTADGVTSDTMVNPGGPILPLLIDGPVLYYSKTNPNAPANAYNEVWRTQNGVKTKIGSLAALRGAYKTSAGVVGIGFFDTGAGLFRMDGVTGITPYQDFPAQGVYAHAEANNRLYLCVGAYPGSEVTFWQTDGTMAETSELGTFPSAGPDWYYTVRTLFVRDSLLLFSGADPTLGYELWKIDLSGISSFSAGPMPETPWEKADHGRLFDASGRLVWSGPLTAGRDLPIDLRVPSGTALPPGVYLMQAFEGSRYLGARKVVWSRN